MFRLGKRIAILATGDEIVNGEILNTNGQYIAQQCFQNNIQPGIEMTVSDDQAEMESAIRFLLQDHAVVITLGGLGPTSDDRTRFALSAAIEHELIYDEPSWDRIVKKLTSLSLDVPENNKRQCYFPKGAEIYPNENGTASACYVDLGEKSAFMLPGPPNEFQTLFDRYVLPKLLTLNLQHKIYRQSWMLFGVSEGRIAEQLDPMIQGANCDIGYRVSYPYLEVKLQSVDQKAIEKLSKRFDEILGEKLISKTKQRASDLFIDYLQSHKLTFSILDEATNGLLATTLLSPKTYSSLFFNGESADIQVRIEGLNAYWTHKTSEKYTDIHIVISKNSKRLLDKNLKIPMRKEKTPIYAVEIICQEVLNGLKAQNLN